MIVAVIIHAVLALIYLGSSEYGFLFYITGFIVLLNILGIVLIKMNKTIPGAWVFLISSACMIPIGIIGALGARKLIDEEKKKVFYNAQNN